MSLKKSLDSLKYSRKLFESFSAGKHIDLVQESELWNALTGEHRESYEQLFDHLGQNLVINPRGFAYFEIEDSNAKGPRPLALLYLLIFQKQADAGQDLNRFDQWILDSSFFAELRDKNRDLLRDEKLESDDRWKFVINKAVNLGFFAKEGTSFILLPATWRFLDLFLELSDELDDSVEDTEEEYASEEEFDEIDTIEEEEL